MKQHLLGLATAILTFVVGWSIPAVILKPATESIVLPPVATPWQASSAWTILLAWQNQDLSQIDGPEEAQLEMAIESLRVTKNESVHPRLFAPVSTFLGEPRYVLIEDAPLFTIPGVSRLQMSVFDQDGKLLDSSEFSAGWRILTDEIKFVQVKNFREVLEVQSFPVINGADIRKQYYALVGDKMRLVRLEDSKGVLRANAYGSPNHTIGFTELGRSAEDWEESLKTKDEAQSLATLTWLGGYHLDITYEGLVPGYWHEDLAEVRLVEEVRARPGVRKIVNSLKDAKNPWLREAARLAAEQMHESASER